jgi:2-methylcitrate dehydratase
MSRKSWAAGDACQKAVDNVLKVLRGEGGIPTVLSAPVWGFYDVAFGGKKFEFQRPYGSYVMENVLFKVSYPAEFHSQTAIEAAAIINKKLASMGKTAEDIEKVTNRTHEACIRIIDKQFKPMDNFADRDHCVQYMVANMFVFNRLVATDYTDGGEAATSPLLESLRQRIECVEDPQLTKDYHDPAKRTIANALTVTLKDGTVLDEVLVEAPLGHRLRREEAKPEILKKYKNHIGKSLLTPMYYCSTQWNSNANMYVLQLLTTQPPAPTSSSSSPRTSRSSSPSMSTPTSTCTPSHKHLARCKRHTNIAKSNVNGKATKMF